MWGLQMDTAKLSEQLSAEKQLLTERHERERERLREKAADELHKLADSCEQRIADALAQQHQQLAQQ